MFVTSIGKTEESRDFVCVIPNGREDHLKKRV